jgi:hypothetical protein
MVCGIGIAIKMIWVNWERQEIGFTKAWELGVSQKWLWDLGLPLKLFGGIGSVKGVSRNWFGDLVIWARNGLMNGEEAGYGWLNRTEYTNVRLNGKAIILGLKRSRLLFSN